MALARNTVKRRVYHYGSGQVLTDDRGNQGNIGSFLNILGWTTANKNWQINVDGSTSGLKFLASTAAGGATFTTALMALSEAGVLSISSGLANSLTLSGSATNPTIGVTGGSLAITPSVVVARLI